MPNRELTEPRWDIFLDTLRKSANVSKSALTAGISRAAVYKHRSKNIEFSKEWDDALEESLDMLEEEARRRAYEGIKEGVWYQGEEVGETIKYSDTLMQFLLRAYRPQKFGQGFTGRKFGQGFTGRKTEITLSTSGDARADLKAEITDYAQLRDAARDVRQIIEGEYEPVSSPDE